jgi:hypothetical protein
MHPERSEVSSTHREDQLGDVQLPAARQDSAIVSLPPRASMGTRARIGRRRFCRAQPVVGGRNFGEPPFEGCLLTNYIVSLPCNLEIKFLHSEPPTTDPIPCVPYPSALLFVGFILSTGRP